MTQFFNRRELLRLGGAATMSAIATGCASTSGTPASTPAPPPAVKVSSGFVTDPSTYFEVLQPAVSSGKPPILLIHGAAHTGACYMATADGRPGWAQRFVARGYPVVVPDWAGAGRSGYVPYDNLTGELVVKGLSKVLATMATPAIVVTHSMSGPFGWKLMELQGEKITAMIGVAPGASGNVAAPVEFVTDTTDSLQVRLAPGGPLLKFSKGIPFVAERDWALRKLVGDGNRFPKPNVDKYLSTLTPVPPRLLLERVDYQGTSPRVKNTANFAGKRIAVIQAPHDADNTVAVLSLTVNWLASTGASVDFIQLQARGIGGNGHMMMLESNSDQIADGIIAWIESGRFPDASA